MSSDKNQEQLRGSFREKGPSAPIEPAPEAPEISETIAKKAKSEWAKRLGEGRKQGKGFNMSARGI